MKLLLDTSVIIDFLRQKNKESTRLYALSQEDLFLSIITHTELYAGKSVWEKRRAKNELEQVFSGMTILPLQQEISQKAGYIKAHHPAISLLDCIIAATALHHTLPLVTINRKDFFSIPQLSLYPLGE